jgi:hypothetical protein
MLTPTLAMLAVPRGELSPLETEAGHRQSLRTVCRLPKAIGVQPMAARRRLMLAPTLASLAIPRGEFSLLEAARRGLT